MVYGQNQLLVDAAERAGLRPAWFRLAKEGLPSQRAMPGSQSALATTSAPMPMGSPMEMPITGRSVVVGFGVPSAELRTGRF